jgi:predicted metalloprotease with PDZ domain
MSRIHFFCLQIFLVMVLFYSAFTKPPEPQISYQITWNEPNGHLLKITMRIEKIQFDSLQVSIPAWRPGRYIIQNFAKNVINFMAEDENGQTLMYKKLDKGSWQIKGNQSGSVVVKYAYYARQLDAGASYLDDSEAYINPVTCLMYIPGLELLPVQLTISKPKGWKIATALHYDESSKCFISPNYHELVDAPVLISPSFKLLSFDYNGANIEIAIQGQANYDEKRLTKDIYKIVDEQVQIMNDLPLDYFLFMYHLVPYRFGHGVEHKNSTSIVSGPADFSDEKFYMRFLGTTSHEFFHVWNVERIRPQAIYLPDYSKENYTGTMWIYEGLTSYYGDLTLIRQQLRTKEEYLENWAKTIARFQDSYGRKVTSVDQVSWDSWTKGMHNAPPNTYYSYYTKGEILGLLLDLEIRNRTGNKNSLDEVMRYLNSNYAMKNRGVPENAFQKILETVAGSTFNSFFADYVYGTSEIDYNHYLKYAGLELIKELDENSADVYLGISTSGDEKQTRIRNVIPESPAFKAGLDIDDILIAIDDQHAHSKNLNLLLKNYSAGDTIRITVIRREVLRNFNVKLAEAAADTYKIREIKEPSELQSLILKSWLKD